MAIGRDAEAIVRAIAALHYMSELSGWWTVRAPSWIVHASDWSIATLHDAHGRRLTIPVDTSWCEESDAALARRFVAWVDRILSSMIRASDSEARRFSEDIARVDEAAAPYLISGGAQSVVVRGWCPAVVLAYQLAAELTETLRVDRIRIRVGRRVVAAVHLRPAVRVVVARRSGVFRIEHCPLHFLRYRVAASILRIHQKVAKGG